MDKHATLPQPHDGSEINLLDLLEHTGRWIGRFGRWVYRVCGGAAVFLIRKSLWILGLIALGTAGAFFTYRAPAPYYTASMRLRANLPDKALFTEIVNEANWQRHPGVLSVTAACTGDTADGGGCFLVTVAVSVDTVLPHLRNAILHTLHSTPYLQRQNEARAARIGEEITVLTQQITRLDSLQRLDYFDRDRRRNSPLLPVLWIARSGEKNNSHAQPAAVLYHHDILELIRRRRQLETDLFLNPLPATPVKDFSPPQCHRGSFAAYARQTACLMLLLGLAGFLLWKHRKQIIQRIKNN